MITVTTAAEILAALAKNADEQFGIGGPADIELSISIGRPFFRVSGAAQLRLEARDSSAPSVEAWGSSAPRVVALGSSAPSVVAWDSSAPRVVAWESSAPSVVAWDSSAPSVEARGSSAPSVEAWGSSAPSVVARGSSAPSVEAWGSSAPSVVARDSSAPHVVARDSSAPRVVAWGSSAPRVVALGSSAPSVVAWDSSAPRVVAWESSAPSVVAWGSSAPSVEARGSSAPSVEAWGSSAPRVVALGSSAPSVVAWDSSAPSVEAQGYAQLRLFGATIKAVLGANVAVLLHRGAKATGGKQTRVTIKTANDWCEYYGVAVDNGVATLYKALNADFTSPYETSYAPGTIPVAADWDGGAQECGLGLHFSPLPAMALQFHASATKFAACRVALVDIAIHPDGEYPQKVKARGCCGPCYEVTLDGEPMGEIPPMSDAPKSSTPRTKKRATRKGT